MTKPLAKAFDPANVRHALTPATADFHIGQRVVRIGGDGTRLIIRDFREDDSGDYHVRLASDHFGLFEAQLRTAGSLTLSPDNAERFLAQRALTVRPDPDRPGLVRIEPAPTRIEP